MLQVAFFMSCSVAKMTSLKQLDLNSNDLRRDKRLSDKLSALKNLKILYLWDYKLNELPDRYVTDNVLLLLYLV